jgi:hypothetical protein
MLNGQQTKIPQSQMPATRARLFGLGFAGVWLILLIVSTVFVAVIIFSATQFQIRFSNFILSGGSLSIWKAEQMRIQWHFSREAAQEAIDTARRALNETQQQRTKAFTARNQITGKQNKSWTDLLRIRDQLSEKVLPVDSALAIKLKDNTTSIYEYSTLVFQKLDQLQTKDPSISDDLRAFVQARVEWQKDAHAAYVLNEEIESLTKGIEANRTDLKLAEDSSRLVIQGEQGKTVPDDQRAQIENAIYEFDAMHDVWWGLVYRLTLIPSDVLVLALVIAMGLLGSSLQLVYVYVTQFEQKSVSYYLVRPFFGIIMAFVIYIVAKAGIPLVTDTTRLGTTTSINPYFISFIAIISGLMSERALTSLLRLGTNYFRDTDGTEQSRWARTDLTKSFQEANRDPDKLRKLLKAKTSEWDEWIKGKEPMPGSAQVIIAGVLEQDRRDLFTDIPPDADQKPQDQQSEQDEPKSKEVEPKKTEAEDTKPEKRGSETSEAKATENKPSNDKNS